MRRSISSTQSADPTTMISADAQPSGAKSSSGVVQSRKKPNASRKASLACHVVITQPMYVVGGSSPTISASMASWTRSQSGPQAQKYAHPVRSRFKQKLPSSSAQVFRASITHRHTKCRPLRFSQLNEAFTESSPRIANSRPVPRWRPMMRGGWHKASNDSVYRPRPSSKAAPKHNIGRYTYPL
jgi:hypothetical protein